MLVCPICDEPGLKIVQSMKLLRSMDWDERALQAIRCPACEACFHGEYLEERRGARERFSHSATPLGADLFERFATALETKDLRRAQQLMADGPGESTYLQYRAASGAAPLSRSTAPQLPPPFSPAQARSGWFERFRTWLKN